MIETTCCLWSALLAARGRPDGIQLYMKAYGPRASYSNIWLSNRGCLVGGRLRLAALTGTFSRNSLSFVWEGLRCRVDQLLGEVDVDVAPFGYPLVEKESVGVKWAEMRRLVRVEIEFADGAPPLPAQGAMQVQYWHHDWDGSPLRGYGEQAAGRHVVSGGARCSPD